jgi:hypothetical protein
MNVIWPVDQIYPVDASVVAVNMFNHIVSLAEVLMWCCVQIHAEGTIDDVFSHVENFLDKQLG